MTLLSLHIRQQPPTLLLTSLTWQWDYQPERTLRSDDKLLMSVPRMAP